MLKKTFINSILGVTLCSTLSSAADHRVLVNIMPASILVSSDVDGFRNYSSTYYSYASEEIEGDGTFAPNLSIGYGLDLPYFSLDTTVGAGVLVNGVFTATYLQGELGAYLTTAQKGFMIGPFVRYMDIADPEWDTDNLEMRGTDALAYGISMMTGGSKVKFKLSVSSLSGADILVRGVNGYTSSSPFISLDGLIVELGLGLRF